MSADDSPYAQLVEHLHERIVPMRQRKVDPAAQVVEFFETAPLAAAHTVLGIATSIVAKRMPPRRQVRERVNDDASVTNHDGISVDK